jgi:1-phosphatidylinositol-4-phosphate 5-kinase
MIKTQTPEENKFLRRILPHYYKYLVENPNSLLVRFYGMHRVKMYHLRRKVHFVIMASVFDTTETIHTVYDLKVRNLRPFDNLRSLYDFSSQAPQLQHRDRPSVAKSAKNSVPKAQSARIWI